MNRYFMVALMAALCLASCKKEDSAYNSSATSELTLEFDNIAGDQQLILNNVNYINAAGESFTVSLLQYYISNIRLKKADGTVFAVPQKESYFLVQEQTPASRLCTVKVPVGEYKEVSFIVGVDSLRSTMPIGERTGVLDPGNFPSGHEGMYWSWNSGYIFLKMEGTSPAAPADPAGGHNYRFHIGGFGGYSSPTVNNIREVTLDLTAKGVAQVKTGRKSQVHINMDIQKIMNGTSNVSLATNSTVMFGAFSSNIADNYRNAFTHVHTHN
jgi:hypothetical protein